MKMKIAVISGQEVVGDIITLSSWRSAGALMLSASSFGASSLIAGLTASITAPILTPIGLAAGALFVLENLWTPRRSHQNSFEYDQNFNGSLLRSGGNIKFEVFPYHFWGFWGWQLILRAHGANQNITKLWPNRSSSWGKRVSGDRIITRENQQVSAERFRASMVGVWGVDRGNIMFVEERQDGVAVHVETYNRFGFCGTDQKIRDFVSKQNDPENDPLASPFGGGIYDINTHMYD